MSIDEAIERHLQSDLPPNIALMHLVVLAGSERELTEALARARREKSASRRARELHDLWQQKRGAWHRMKGVLGIVDQKADRVTPADWAAMFDAVAAISPEDGSALYLLGDEALEAEATTSIVERLERWGCLRPGGAVLDYGCGAGRIAAALGDRGYRVVGVDISQGMLDAAVRRCASLGLVSLVRAPTGSLAEIEGGPFQTAVACDVFPYVRAGGRETCSALLASMRDRLVSDGAICVLNYSYELEPAAQLDEMRGLSEELALELVCASSGGFEHWDASTFILRKP